MGISYLNPNLSCSMIDKVWKQSFTLLILQPNKQPKYSLKYYRMKKSSYLHLLAIMMVAMLSVGFVSCGSDDDDDDIELAEFANFSSEQLCDNIENLIDWLDNAVGYPDDK